LALSSVYAQSLGSKEYRLYEVAIRDLKQKAQVRTIHHAP